MQIPPPPIGNGKPSTSSTTDVSTGNSQFSEKITKISSLSELGLKKEQQYNARVVSLPTNQNQGQSPEKANIPNSLVESKPIIQIGNKFLAVDPPKPLQLNEWLTVRLVNTPSGQALLVSPQNTGAVSSPPLQPTNVNATFSASLNTSNNITKTIQTELSQKNMSVLLNAIGKVLPSQTTTQLGEALLNTIVSNQPSPKQASGSNDQANQITKDLYQVASKTLSILRASLPDAEVFKEYAALSFGKTAAPGKSGTPPANYLNETIQQYIRQMSRVDSQANSGFKSPNAVENDNRVIPSKEFGTRDSSLASQVLTNTTQKAIAQSGQWYESKLRQQPALLESLKNISAGAPAQSETLSNSQSHPTNAPRQIELQNLLQALTTLQSKQNIKAVPSNTTNNNLSPVDLKQTLIQIVTLLSQNQPKSEEHKTNVQPSLHLPNDSPRTPLNFPNVNTLVSNQQQQLKANSILADQDISIGLLLKIAASMLNRIQFNQLNNLFQNANLASDSPLVQTWLLELPLQHHNEGTQTFQIRLDQYRDDNSEKKSDTKGDTNTAGKTQWKILLTFDLPNLGPMCIQVNYLRDIKPDDDNSIESVRTHIWCTDESSHELVKREAPKFSEKLEQLGLKVEQLNCHVGMPTEPKSSIVKGILDVNA